MRRCRLSAAALCTALAGTAADAAYIEYQFRNAIPFVSREITGTLDAPPPLGVLDISYMVIIDTDLVQDRFLTFSDLSPSPAVFYDEFGAPYENAFSVSGILAFGLNWEMEDFAFYLEGGISEPIFGAADIIVDLGSREGVGQMIGYLDDTVYADYFVGGPTTVTATVLPPAFVPLPAPAFLLAGGLCLLGIAGRSRRRSSAARI